MEGQKLFSSPFSASSPCFAPLMGEGLAGGSSDVCRSCWNTNWQSLGMHDGAGPSPSRLQLLPGMQEADEPWSWGLCL